MQISEEIKSKLDIVDVIREYVPNLKAVGVNFSALSPFKREKTPSFIVSPEKQIWHCFSTDKGGDIFSFIMEMEGVSFVEALRILAPKAGVQLKRENPEISSKRNRLLDIMETAVTFYHRTFLESPAAAAARDYIYKKRGLTEATVMEWQIGYSPDSWDDLLNVLKKRGYTEQEILSAGLAIKKEGRNSFYNRFRGRIMFPINDINGNTVAFTARVSPEREATEQMGKYINSPETMLYSKSRVVFGLDKAKMEIKSLGYAIVVEGQMDCISCHQAGFKNVVASSGTAFTAEQLKLIKRYSNNLSLSFDMDSAGQLAADRGIREAFAAEMNIKVITLPEGKDPDELIRRDVEAWKESVAEAKHVMQYYFDKIFAAYNIEESEGKREAARKILPIIARLPDRIEQDHWLKKLAEKLQVGETALRETIAAFKNKDKTYSAPAAAPADAKAMAGKETREEKLSQNILALTMKFPAHFDYIVNKVSLDHLSGADNKSFYRNLIIYYNDNISQAENGRKEINYQDFRNWLASQPDGLGNEGLFRLLEKIVILGDKDFYGLEADKAKNEIIRVIIALKENYLSARRKEIGRLIEQLENEGRVEEAEKLMAELTRLSEESSENNAEGENI
ncbi:MAG TPA: DNA primase [Candidatus Nanoarchaeia archaeon]|nr:DNA primase [Candidatus Nanoarchaeia archaeon]